MNFSKYQGTGNDFILIDNRNQTCALTQPQIAQLCHRKFGIGADGLMLLENAEGYDFKMVYYNADGFEGSMCGNGGRCITRFAHDIGIEKQSYYFIAIDGPHESTIESDEWIKLKMKDVTHVEQHTTFDFLDTGSPHVVKLIHGIDTFDVVGEGKAIRYSKPFEAQGVNVNFVQPLANGGIYVRTYERGVEDETLSCGTGVTAAALVNAINNNGFNHVDIETNGGRLYVEFEKRGDTQFENIWLAGPAKKVFEGIMY